jgi:hypothetical protein
MQQADLRGLSGKNAYFAELFETGVVSRWNPVSAKICCLILFKEFQLVDQHKLLTLSVGLKALQLSNWPCNDLYIAISKIKHCTWL